MSYYYNGVLGILICFLISVSGHRDLFDKKCKRECNTQRGSLDCWKATTDGFTYGLSTAMIDYCQVILQIRQMTDDKLSSYNITRDILTSQINGYSLNPDVHQLTKINIEQIATTLLNKCFYASSSISSLQPSCPSCSIKQVQLIKQWRLMTIILISICLLFILVTLFVFTLHTHHTRRSYESIG